MKLCDLGTCLNTLDNRQGTVKVNKLTGQPSRVHFLHINYSPSNLQRAKIFVEKGFGS